MLPFKQTVEEVAVAVPPTEEVTVKVKVDDLGGEVTLFDGNTYNLTDALKDENNGWEIDSEVNWGIDTYFKKNITLKTGIKVIFFRLD